MKILLLVSGFPTKDNPARCIFNYRAAIGLSKFHEVQVIFFRLWKPGRKIVTKVHSHEFELLQLALPGHPSMDFAKLLSFTRLSAIFVRSEIEKAEIIHSVGASSMGIVGSYLADRFAKPHVTQLIGSDVNTVLPKSKDSLLVKGWEKSLHGISANSNAILNEFKSLYPSVNCASTVNYRGVDLETFDNSGEKGNVRFILFLGGLPDYPDLPHGENTKGGQSLMRIWQQVEKKIEQNSKVVLLFGGPGSNKQEALDWHKTLRSPEMVNILGNIEPVEVAAWMRKSSLVLLPSKEEGTPNVGFEALGSGIAILGSDVGGIPELVQEGQNGWLLDPGDEDAWVDQLIRLTRADFDLAPMGAASRKLAEEKFDHKHFALRLNELYSHLKSKN